MNHFAIHLKLTQYYKAAILQLKKIGKNGEVIKTINSKYKDRIK